MLHFFRQRGLSNLLYGAIIVATILTFVIEFRPSATSRTASLGEACVARVHGRCLDPKDFAAAYRMLLPTRSARRSRQLNLRRVAIDGLVERELLDEQAGKLGLSVTDDEVTDQLFAGFVRVSVPVADPMLARTILQDTYQAYVRAGLLSQDVALAHLAAEDMTIPVDFRDPKTHEFNLKIYERQVRNLSNRSTAEFREGQARELLAAKVRDAIRSPVRVDPSELWQDYSRARSTATVQSIVVKEAWAARWMAPADPAALAQWIKAHQTQVDQALKERLAEDAPQAGHIRHILIKLADAPTDDDKAAALAKLSWAASLIRAGEPFAEVARQMSEDTSSAARGGDVGDKTTGLVPAFKAAADALAPGQMTSGAVLSELGYHLIARDDPAQASRIERQVRELLPQELMARERATAAAQGVASAVATSIRAGQDPAQAIAQAVGPYLRKAQVPLLSVLPPPATEGPDAGAPKAAATQTASVPFDASTDPDGPRLSTSEPFNADGEPLPGLSPDASRAIVAFAFAAKDGETMKAPVRTADGFAVVRLQSRKQATRAQFSADAVPFRQQVLRAKRDEALALYVRQLRERAKSAIAIDPSYVKESAAGSSDDDEDQF